MSSAADPAVAIVVRTKDRPQFLERALASITGQTTSSWECVVVNDGGDPAVVDALISGVPEQDRDRFTVVHAPESRGRWKSANAGVLASRAPLVVLHDDDDSWHPRFLARAIEYLQAHPDRDGVVSRIEIVWEERSASGLVEVSREVFQPHLHDLLLSDALLFNRYVPIGFVYRRRLHEELGLYDDALPVVGDWAFNLKVLARGPLEFLGPEPLAYWHQRVSGAGVHGNSVNDARGDHEKFDALIRDEALRAHVAESGLGLVLYLTSFIDRRFVEVEAGIRREVADSQLDRRLRRRIRDLVSSRRGRRRG
jgi:glycosyltransferase involved in cell wall biosynthesis